MKTIRKLMKIPTQTTITIIRILNLIQAIMIIVEEIVLFLHQVKVKPRMQVQMNNFHKSFFIFL